MTNIRMTLDDGADIRRLAEKVRDLRDRAVAEVGKIVVGMEHVTLQFLIALLASGHVLLEGVYRLPEAQLDRFLLRVEMGYPGRLSEVNLLKLHSQPAAEVRQLFNAELILEVQRQLSLVHGNEGLLQYIVDLAEASRSHPDLALGASPRASLNLLRCARARALLDGRYYFTHEDIHAVARGVLAHRLIVRPEAEVEGKRAEEVVEDLLRTVPVLETATR